MRRGGYSPCSCRPPRPRPSPLSGRLASAVGLDVLAGGPDATYRAGAPLTPRRPAPTILPAVTRLFASLLPLLASLLLAAAAPRAAAAQERYVPPTPPGGFLAPDDLQVAPPEGVDPAKRPADWVSVAAVPEAKRTDLYAKLTPLAGGPVHVIFRNGASVKVELQGCATTGIVTKNDAGQRIIYEFSSVEWVRATR